MTRRVGVMRCRSSGRARSVDSMTLNQRFGMVEPTKVVEPAFAEIVPEYSTC